MANKHTLIGTGNKALSFGGYIYYGNYREVDYVECCSIFKGETCNILVWGRIQYYQKYIGNKVKFAIYVFLIKIMWCEIERRSSFDNVEMIYSKWNKARDVNMMHTNEYWSLSNYYLLECNWVLVSCITSWRKRSRNLPKFVIKFKYCLRILWRVFSTKCILNTWSILVRKAER